MARIVSAFVADSRTIALRSSLRNKKILRRVKRKNQIGVAFQVVHASVWKLDHLYRLLERSQRFKPFVVICPFFSSSPEIRSKEYELTRKLCEKNGYLYFDSISLGLMVPLEKIAMPTPDIVFIQNAYDRTYPEYQSGSWKESLVCYVSYFFTMNILSEKNYGKAFHKKIWFYFLESRFHLRTAMKQRKSFDQRNLVVTGYPGLDPFLYPTDTEDPWRARSSSADSKIRVIYAPHHTVYEKEGGLGYSTFEDFSGAMLELAERHTDEFQFAFKPHPLLYEKLLNHPDWGPSRTNHYWKRWEALPGCLVEEGDYTALFQHSDALIHDSNSFLAEYLSTGKPALFLLTRMKPTQKLNEAGQRMLQCHAIAGSQPEIEEFLTTLKSDRKILSPELSNLRVQIFEQFLVESRKFSASELIYRHLDSATTS
jgi:hypothetical protein